MKLVILIAVHKNPQQVNRLMRALKHPDITIYLHIDKKSRISAGEFLPEAKIIRNNTSVYWSTYSQVQATLNSLREILEREQTFGYLAFISGQDYPVMTASEILASVKDHQGKELIGHVILDQNGWYKARTRFERFHFISFRNPLVRSFGRVITYFCDGFGWKRKFYKGMIPYGGSSWWTLSKDCIEYILSFTDSHKGYIRFMKKTVHPDEMFFQSLIMNSPFKDRAENNYLRYIEWLKVKGNKSPIVLTVKEFPTIISSGMHFARKFDIQTDEKILDMIDSYLESRKGCSSTFRQK